MFFVYNTYTDTYKHKPCAAQMCFPPDPSAQRNMIIAVLQVSFHTLYSKDMAYIGRNREKEISGWGRGLVQEVVPVPGGTSQRQLQRLSCSPANRAMTTGEWWVFAFISTPKKHHSFHKLGRVSLAPGISFLQRHAQTSSFRYLQSNQRCYGPQVHVTVCDCSAKATASLVKGHVNASIPTSVQSQPGKLKPSPLDGWEETPGAW